MTNELTKMILEIIFSFVGLVISTVSIWAIKNYVAPWLKTKLGDAKYQSLLDRLGTFMSAAEERFGVGQGKDKSAWVIEQVQGIFPEFPAEYIQALIDGLMAPLANEGLVNAK